MLFVVRAGDELELGRFSTVLCCAALAVSSSDGGGRDDDDGGAPTWV